MKCYIRRLVKKSTAYGQDGEALPYLIAVHAKQTQRLQLTSSNNMNHLCCVPAKETNRMLGHVKRSLILRPGEETPRLWSDHSGNIESSSLSQFFSETWTNSFLHKTFIECLLHTQHCASCRGCTDKWDKFLAHMGVKLQPRDIHSVQISHNI